MTHSYINLSTIKWVEPAARQVIHTRFYSVVINSCIRHKRNGGFCEGYVDQWLPVTIQWLNGVQHTMYGLLGH